MARSVTITCSASASARPGSNDAPARRGRQPGGRYPFLMGHRADRPRRGGAVLMLHCMRVTRESLEERAGSGHDYIQRIGCFNGIHEIQGQMPEEFRERGSRAHHPAFSCRVDTSRRRGSGCLGPRRSRVNAWPCRHGNCVGVGDRRLGGVGRHPLLASPQSQRSPVTSCRADDPSRHCTGSRVDSALARGIGHVRCYAVP
jgi:hypothetical protein